MNDSVNLVFCDEPSAVEIAFTVEELRGLFGVIVGKGVMNGAWSKLQEAESLLKKHGVAVR